MDRYDITLPLVCRASLFHHWKDKSISFGGKSTPLPLVGGQLLVIGGRASHYHWWEGHSIAIWLVRHLIAIGGKGTPLPFGGKGIPVAFQEDTAGLSSGYSNDIIGMV